MKLHITDEALLATMAFYHTYAVAELKKMQFTPNASNRRVIYKMTLKRGLRSENLRNYSFSDNVLNVSALLLLLHNNKKIIKKSTK